jgi:hypothetical protein
MLPPNPRPSDVWGYPDRVAELDFRRGAGLGLGLVVAGVVGCATPVSHAVVTQPGATGRPPRTLLVLPTTCSAPNLGAWLCTPASYAPRSTPEASAPKTFAKMIDPLLRLKLELAGFTLADADVMFLETSAAPADEPATLATLPPGEQRDVARALGLEGIASAELVVRAADAPVALRLVLRLQAFAGGWPGMDVRCEERYESVRETSTILANCVGDGVLAAVAPDALLGRLP